MTQTNRHFRLPRNRASATWKALGTFPDGRKTKRLAVRHSADAAIGKIDIQPHSIGDGDALADRRHRPLRALKRSPAIVAC
jgi:hypothetical protein